MSGEMPFVEAVYTVNRVSQDYLVRPMGIFQLIDYVGLDVCQCILGVMNARLPAQALHSALLDRLLEQGVKGGQHHDGSQKDGFLHYEQGRPTGVVRPGLEALRRRSRSSRTAATRASGRCRNPRCRGRPRSSIRRRTRRWRSFRSGQRASHARRRFGEEVRREIESDWPAARG